MSGGAGPTKRKILLNFYGKVAQIVTQSRCVPALESSSHKRNTWFNLSLYDTDRVKELVEPWTSDHADLTRPLSIEVALDASRISSTQVLLLNGREWSSDPNVPNPRYITLEHWSISLDRRSVNDREDRAVLYKRLIVLIRSVYAYVTSMSTYAAFRRCKGKKLGNAHMVCRISKDTLNPMDFGHYTGTNTSEFVFGQVMTPEGILTVRVRYRPAVQVEVNEHEQLLSSRFIEDYYNAIPTRSKANYATSAPEPGFLDPSALRPAKTMPNVGGHLVGEYQEGVGVTRVREPIIRRSTISGLANPLGSVPHSMNTAFGYGSAPRDIPVTYRGSGDGTVTALRSSLSKSDHASTSSSPRHLHYSGARDREMQRLHETVQGEVAATGPPRSGSAREIHTVYETTAEETTNSVQSSVPREIPFFVGSPMSRDAPRAFAIGSYGDRHSGDSHMDHYAGTSRPNTRPATPSRPDGSFSGTSSLQKYTSSVPIAIANKPPSMPGSSHKTPPSLTGLPVQLSVTPFKASRHISSFEKDPYNVLSTSPLLYEGLAFAASPTSTEELSTFIKQVEEPPALKMFGHDPTASLIHLADELAELRTLRHDFAITSTDSITSQPNSRTSTPRF